MLTLPDYNKFPYLSSICIIMYTVFHQHLLSHCRDYSFIIFSSISPSSDSSLHTVFIMRMFTFVTDKYKDFQTSTMPSHDYLVEKWKLLVYLNGIHNMLVFTLWLSFVLKIYCWYCKQIFRCHSFLHMFFTEFFVYFIYLTPNSNFLLNNVTVIHMACLRAIYRTCELY